MRGQIFNIQRFCINDGPGIRTTVFFKGCPLRCMWCHNPESYFKEPSLFHNKEKCLGCEECTKNPSLCPGGALRNSGESLSVEDIITIALKDNIYYNESNGGITLSGGEPFMQFEFLTELLLEAKKNNLHTCIETCGHAKTEFFLKAIPYTDIFLYDYKLTDCDLHKKYTGKDNLLILKNLKALNDNGARIILRCPIIPKVNDNELHFRGIANILNTHSNIAAAEIEPYHSLGEGKREQLGFCDINKFSTPSKEDVKNYISSIQKLTLKPVRES